MEFLDVNQHHDRILRVTEINRLQPSAIRELSDEDRSVIEDYFLGAAQADDPDEYRAAMVKSNQNIELAADRAYNALLGVAGIGESLTEPTGNYDDDLHRKVEQ